MKKFIAILAVVAVGATFTACKKSYTCTCTSTYNGQSTTSSYTSPKIKKSTAKTWCEGNAGSSYGYSYSCSLD